jgi:glycosyltransferase involved in cell wall biosynthesis
MTLSVVLCLHREGLVAVGTLRSIRSQLLQLEAAGVRAELVAVLDRPDTLTREVLEAHAPASTVQVLVDLGDPGMSRNEGVRRSRGKFIAMLDGDDLFGDSWLRDALAAVKPGEVLHPEFNVYFPRDPHIMVHVSGDDPDFDPSQLKVRNYWTALSFASRQVYLDHPFSPAAARDGFGHEDWTWNMRTVAAGVPHRVVRGTAHFIRQKVSGSRLQEGRKASVLARPPWPERSSSRAEDVANLQGASSPGTASAP